MRWRERLREWRYEWEGGRETVLALLARFGRRRYITTVCRGSILGRHKWQPVSIEPYDDRRAGDFHDAIVRAVCLRCREHTYAQTRWAGYYLGLPRRPKEDT